LCGNKEYCKKNEKWWNEEVTASVKEKQRSFKLWVVSKKCMRECICVKTRRTKIV
jgi:hypothetical protein